MKMKLFRRFGGMATMAMLGAAMVLTTTSCGETRPVKEFNTFEEMADPTDDVQSDWSHVTKGLHASFVSIDKRFAKSLAPDVEVVRSASVEGWKGETVSAQILLWSAEDVEQVEVEIEDFKSGKGLMSAKNAQARFVRYVMTDEFAGGCGYRKPEDFAASLSADMLDNLDNFNIEGRTVRPVWITIDIPRDADAGDYLGRVKLYAERGYVDAFDLLVRVIDRQLPEPKDWRYHLDLWQHPSAVARVHNLEVWSDAHFEKMRPLMKMLADAGQKVITATLNVDPWNHQCYDAYEDMILWTKKKDGSWNYDYKIFDRWVEFMMGVGVNKMINCYSLLTWNNQLHYMDEAKGDMVTVELKAQSKEYAELWGTFLKDFTKHLSEKGWLEITNIAMDERGPEDMKAAMKVLEETAPELGISLADNHKSYKQYPDIKDISVGAVKSAVDKKDIPGRRERGLVTTWYVCCADPFPNEFTFSAPAEAAYAGWHTVAADLDGMLRWAYNSWVENPLTDSRFRTWPAGDTYIVYPDARSSIRFERLKEGIQDAEKIWILRNEVANGGNEEAATKMAELEKAIEYFDSVSPSDDWNEKLNEAKKLLNSI
ncbi:MAG: glycoside hydrolase domain-containing protein [Fermentimonas sp.]|jgi:hypothetical protein